MTCRNLVPEHLTMKKYALQPFPGFIVIQQKVEKKSGAPTGGLESDQEVGLPRPCPEHPGDTGMWTKTPW